jgi:hypothetical protein
MPEPFSPERMKPLDYEAAEGRANPKGIPYLYGATQESTAIAEVRPWIGSWVSVGQFRTLRPLKILDCSSELRRSIIYFSEPDAEKRRAAVWQDIDKGFSQPITPTDRSPEYVPTQVLAELFRVSGYDGIAYQSALGGGHNLTLFDVTCADLINCGLYEVRKMNFEFDQVTNRYFVTKYYEKAVQTSEDRDGDVSADSSSN